MYSRRGSTSSPIRSVNMRSASTFRFDGILHRDLDHLAPFGIHRGLPELMGVHFTKTFVALDLESLAAVFLDLLEELGERVDGNFLIVLFDPEDRCLSAEQSSGIVSGLADPAAEFQTGFRFVDCRDVDRRVQAARRGSTVRRLFRGCVVLNPGKGLFGLLDEPAYVPGLIVSYLKDQESSFFEMLRSLFHYPSVDVQPVCTSV